MIQPFARNSLKRIRALMLARDALCLTLVRRVNALLDQFAGTVTGLPSVGQTHRRVRVYREHVLFARNSIAVAPQLCARWSDLKIQPPTIRELVGFIRRLGVANAGIGESHSAGILTEIPTTIPAFMMDVNGTLRPV